MSLNMNDPSGDCGAQDVNTPVADEKRRKNLLNVYFCKFGNFSPLWLFVNTLQSGIYFMVLPSNNIYTDHLVQSTGSVFL